MNNKGFVEWLILFGVALSFMVFAWAVDWFRDDDCDSNCHQQVAQTASVNHDHIYTVGGY